MEKKQKYREIVEFRTKKTGPGHNKELFESAAELAEVGRIQVLVKKTSKVFKFHLDNSTKKTMQVHCDSDTVKHPSYSLQLNDGYFAEWCVDEYSTDFV